ncbi:hypothetical protein [Duganella sp. HH105]|uniref:hypothetical protein n=1 Tax=Duganella sp. HH105 TaxID=1781067 RepID=UPI000877CDC5|nr:hypothetical protein [Duganella sp. HH105]
MAIHQYLQDTAFAAKNLFALATEEEHQLSALSEGLQRTEGRLKIHQWDFQTSDLNDDFSDAYVMAAFVRAAKAGQEVERLQREVATLQASVGTHQHAVQAIAGAIFQIAKQGISLVHGGLGSVPAGRKMGSLALRDIVWQARNQSMHYEEGNPKKAVLDLFAILEKEHGPHFSLVAHAGQNRAKQVLDVLGWTNYELYLRDMQSLLP